MANPTGEPHMNYYGRVNRIPWREYENDPYAFLHRDLIEDFPSLLRAYGGAMPAPGGPLERYQVRDVDTGDVLVMWRLPYLVFEHDHPDAKNDQ